MAWRVVLVRPRNPLNIGAAARAMANFGMKDLAVVSPYEAGWREAQSAVGAEPLLHSALATEDLAQGLGEATLVLGTTTGRRRTLDRSLISVAELADWVKRQKGHRRAALLFGSEKTGLSNEHLSFCHALIRIPTLAVQPSMNLGQAVAVCCYELARSGLIRNRGPAFAAHASSPAPAVSLEHLLARAIRLLDESGYFKPKARNAQVRKLRRFLFDLRLTNYDARVLGGVLAQLAWKIEQGSER